MDNNFEQHTDDKKDFNNSDDIMKNNKHNEVSPNNEESSNNTTILTFTEIEALKEKLLDNKYEGDDSQKKKAIEQATFAGWRFQQPSWSGRIPSYFS